jgi:Helix-turn-helix domain
VSTRPRALSAGHRDSSRELEGTEFAGRRCDGTSHGTRAAAVGCRARRIASSDLGRRDVRSAAAAVGCSTKSIQRLMARTSGLKPRAKRDSLRLSLAEREEVSRGLGAAESARAIAARPGRAPSTVARDIVANGGRRNSRAWRAGARAAKLTRRPKVPKLARCPRRRHEVERRPAMRWSPQQIAARLLSTIPRIATCACRPKRSTGRCLCKPAKRTKPFAGLASCRKYRRRPAKARPASLRCWLADSGSSPGDSSCPSPQHVYAARRPTQVLHSQSRHSNFSRRALMARVTVLADIGTAPSAGVSSTQRAQSALAPK